MIVPTGTPDVLLRTEGRAGFITLHRPRAINALTHAMVLAVDAALDAWEHDPAVTTVVIEGAGDRGLVPEPRFVDRSVHQGLPPTPTRVMISQSARSSKIRAVGMRTVVRRCPVTGCPARLIQ